MGDDDECLPVLVAELKEKVVQLFGMPGVEIARRLVS